MSFGERRKTDIPGGVALAGVLSALSVFVLAPPPALSLPIPADLRLDSPLPAGMRAESRANPHDTMECGRCHEATDLNYDTAMRFGLPVPLVTEGDISSLLCEGCHGENPHFFHPVDISVGERAASINDAGIFPLELIFEGMEKLTCATCHDLHFPHTGNHLLRGFSMPSLGPQGPFEARLDFCRSCHGEAVEEYSAHWEKDKARESCNFCHLGRTGPDVPGPLKRNINELCVVCHPLPSGRVPHYYSYNPFPDFERSELPEYGLLLDRGQFTCTTCHLHHRPAESEGFLRPGFISVVSKSLRVNPHRTTKFCQNCHPFTPPPVGTPGASAPIWEEDVTRLCRGCHSKEGALQMSHPLTVPSSESMVPQGWPTRRDGSLGCQTCHLDGHGPPDPDNPRMLRGGSGGDRNDVCFLCHRRQDYEGRNIHAEVADFKGCEFCHVVKERTALRPEGKVGDLLAEPSFLCLPCHSPLPHPASARHTVRPERKNFLTLDAEKTPLTLGKVTCHTCHDSHASPSQGRMLRRIGGRELFCNNCHPF